MSNDQPVFVKPLPAEPRTAWRGAWTWTGAALTPEKPQKSVYALFRREFTCTNGSR